MIRLWTTVLLLLLYFGGVLCPAAAQLKKDRRAERHFEHGQEALRDTLDYAAAVTHFEKATERRFNYYTTPSLYMSGLCYYYMNDYDRAIRYFEQLLREYPQSVYAPEVIYHKSRLMLRTEDKRAGGLYLLMKLILQQDGSEDLVADAKAALHHFFFKEADEAFLKEYLEQVRPEFRGLVLEALCWRAYQNREVKQLARYIQRAERTEDAQRVSRLRDLVKKPPIQQIDTLRIAIALPFCTGVTKPSQATRSASRRAMELMAGMEIAFGEFRRALPHTQVIVRTFDTYRETGVTEEVIRTTLKSFRPDVIVGGLYTEPSLVLARYARAHDCIQLVPLSTSEELVTDTTNVFLANPSIPTQLRAILKYTHEKLGKKRYLVVSDQGRVAEMLTHAFVDRAKAEELAVRVVRIQPEGYNPPSKFQELISILERSDFDALYFPSYQESFVEDLLEALRDRAIYVQILATPDWGRFRKIDRQLMADFDVIYHDIYYPRNDTNQFSKLSAAYEDQYQNVPSRYVCQGYDVVRYLMTVIEEGDPDLSIEERIHRAEPFRGVIQNYYYARGHDNQSVQLLKIEYTGIKRLRTW